MSPKSPKKQPEKKKTQKTPSTPPQDYWFYFEEKIYKTIDGIHTIIDDDTGETLGTLSEEAIENIHTSYLQKKYHKGAFWIDNMDGKEYKTNDIGEHIVIDVATGKMLEKISDAEMYTIMERYELEIQDYDEYEFEGKIYTTKNGIHTVTDAKTGEDLGSVSNFEMRHIVRKQRKSEGLPEELTDEEMQEIFAHIQAKIGGDIVPIPPRFRKTYIFLGIFFPLYFGFQLKIGGIAGMFKSISSWILSIGLLYIFTRVFQMIFGKKQVFTTKDAKDFFIRYSRIGAILTIVIFSFIGSFMNHQLRVDPIKMYTYTLSNGEKTVVLQEMSHVASPNFYEMVQKNITQKKQNGYVLFFEGVTPGTEENMNTFRELVGVDITGDLYDRFANMLGLVVQDNDYFLMLENDLDYNVDVSIDDIVAYYTTYCQENPTSLECLPSANILPDSDEVDLFFDMQEKALSKMTEFGRKMVRMLLMAIFNFTMKQVDMENMNIDKHTAFLSNIILTYRNQVVAQTVQESEDTHIILLYGALHSKGIIEELQKYDPKWKVIKLESLYPYQ